MSNLALTWAWGQAVPDPTAKLLLIKLADQANDDGACWPSRGSLASACGVSGRTVTRKAADLANLGLLRIEERKAANGGRASNLYFLPVQAPLDTPVQAPETTVSRQKQPSVEPERETEVSLSCGEKKARPRNLIWDACVAIWGPPANDVETARRAKAVKLYRQAFQADGIEESAAESEIRRRYERYAERYDNVALPSDIALAGRWSDSKPPIVITSRRH